MLIGPLFMCCERLKLNCTIIHPSQFVLSYLSRILHSMKVNLNYSIELSDTYIKILVVFRLGERLMLKAKK